MKRSVLLVLILACTAAAGAQNFSIGPLITWQVQSTTIDETTTSYSDLEFGVVVPIELKGGLEVAPELALILEEDPTTTGFRFGAGLYWAMAKAGAFSLRTGPRALLTVYTEFNGVSKDDDENFSRMNLDLGVPLIADLTVSSFLTLRVMQPIVTMDWTSSGSTTVLSQKRTDSDFAFSSFYTGFNPTFLFLFNL